ncbi:MAG: Asp-tRNA(Asn)/Glu-tRNA(Gln) amidotransferase subunit GatA [Candidatus Paceibacterota bacterium]
MSIHIKTATITDLQSALSDGEETAVSLAEMYLDAISGDETDAFLGTYDDVREQAQAADQRRADGEESPLLGIPLAVKDNILIDGKPVSAGSKILEDYVAPYSATVIDKLQSAGAVLVGRTNMDEFAMGSSTEHSAYQTTKNPHDTGRVPGGSSGGSAAAVAGGLVPAALGSDTGGSVRQPASFCGVVGFKPTYGAVSRYGLIAMGSSLDQIGPLTHSVADAEIIHNTIAGPDKRDSTTYAEGIYGTPTDAPKTIGVPRALLDTDGVSTDVKENFTAALENLKSAGYEIVDIELPALAEALAMYYIIMPAEVSSNLARYDGVSYGLRTQDADLFTQYINTRRDGFGPEVKRRLLLGTYVLSAGYYDAYYRTAVRARQVLEKAFTEVFSKVDAIATPTTPAPAFRIGDMSDDPLEMYMQDVFTVGANIGGVPAISIPSGTSTIEGSELPLGLQLMAANNHEDTLFTIGKDFEQSQT